MNNFDFNLLIILNALLEDNSVNLAAKKLNVTAPAISKSLNKIRILFNDQILVRSGTKLIPTPKAISLKENIKELVNRIESIFNSNIVFEPKITAISFTIASNNAILFILNTMLFQEMKDKAPNAFIHLVNDSDYDDNFLRNHTIDLYIGEIRALNPEITIRTIYVSKCCIISRNHHPILSQTKNMDNLLKYQFIKTKYEHLTNSDEHSKYFWSERNLIGITPEYITTVNAIIHSDALAIIPEFILTTIKKLNISITHFNTDFNLGKKSIIQAWHSKHNHSSAHKWLREFTKKIFLTSII
ncbi:LysR family transcriptional regulator [Blochmannia endosymbiont of Camponotus modoc]|uniref:LysR family transcriptional regulator n=1 Tax=Blochmannia endosymbiont of Camponotus modoc TaxID=2945587 RepID=UPI0020253292|nr:LysR family transcriptional regulator [Blochmannia endosymbiont of Camponotus modoc]URJ31809.1 LysR family transcriptional regulator [Blochmannia endosymbiont of Camponotus modoc]